MKRFLASREFLPTVILVAALALACFSWVRQGVAVPAPEPAPAPLDVTAPQDPPRQRDVVVSAPPAPGTPAAAGAPRS